MNAIATKPRETARTHLREEWPGLAAALAAAVAIAMLWRRKDWPYDEIAPFIAFSVVQTHWQARRLIALRPSRGLPLALGISVFASAVWYLVWRL